MADKLVTIAEFASYMDAELAKQTLANNGIEAVILGANTANLYSISSIANIELQVLEDKAKDASEILKPRQ
ncbi:putative signal transducing protein [Planctomycetota bacterium]